MKTETISVVGLGREGTSIGLAVKKSSLDVQILGHDQNSERVQKALKVGAIDKVQRNLPNAASAADILILAIPGTELEKTLRAIGGVVKQHALVLDLSTQKQFGLRLANTHLQSGHYVGARFALAAGTLFDGRTGPEAADAGQFQDSIFCLMPTAKAEPKAVETAVALGQILGATPYFMDAQEYDSLVQGIETVPGLLAAAMFNAIQKATGWRDLLRFAGLSFAQTTQPLGGVAEISQMALENKEATLRWLDALTDELALTRRFIFEGEEELLEAYLSELDLRRQQWLQQRTENNWVEANLPDYKPPSLTEQMFGGLARRGSARTEE